jgi:hypothetical protein
MNSNQPDDKTLLLLMVIAELLGKKSDAKHILGMYETKVTQLQRYRTS